MERFKVTDLGGKKVMMGFDGSGWRILESLELTTSGVCPACGMDTATSPAAYYAVPRPKHKGKDAVTLCTHVSAEVEQAKKCLGV